MSSLVRYALFQVPGIVLLGAILYALVEFFDLEYRMAGAVLLLWIIKDALLYPIVRRAYETGQDSAHSRLVGRQGEVVEPLSPSGYVRIGGELWRARSRQAPIERGENVVVQSAAGLWLEVEKQ
ncbi:MAG: NfeD family protein [Spirochaetales bacterium]|nr:NfeD family protein [Leptospiraceae bacterium]MCP5480503.1 NfeD family protein [Spirochaetales bacterium]